MHRITTPPRFIVSAGSLMYLVDSFLPWNRACNVQCLSFNLWHGIGILAALTALVLLLCEVSGLLGIVKGVGFPPPQIGKLGAAFLIFFTLLKVAVDHTFLWAGAWLGAPLAGLIAYTAYARGRGARPAPPHDPV